MEQIETLHERLEALGRHLDDTHEKLRQRAAWSDGHALKAQELKTRYLQIKQRLREDIADIEAQGHHVTKLEASVMEWAETARAHA